MTFPEGLCLSASKESTIRPRYLSMGITADRMKVFLLLLNLKLPKLQKSVIILSWSKLKMIILQPQQKMIKKTQSRGIKFMLPPDLDTMIRSKDGITVLQVWAFIRIVIWNQDLPFI